jgi:ribonuclease HI
VCRLSLPLAAYIGLKNVAKKQKFYVVWEGHTTGIFTSWDECKRQIDGHASAKYKSFESRVEAEYALSRNYFEIVAGANKIQKTSSVKSVGKPQMDNSISVDAACAGNPGIMEYQGVVTATKQQIFHNGPYKDGTNNIGEFLGLVHGLAHLKRLGRHDTIIYTDSKTAMAWVRNKKAKTNLELTAHNRELFELIERAEKWLKQNTFKNPIIKWETEVWGEIPADFGRK